MLDKYREADLIDRKWPSDKPIPVYPIYEHYLRFIFVFRNIVDLVTFLPFWSTFNNRGTNFKGSTFLRIFRLLRMVKLFRSFEQVQIMLQLSLKTIEKAVPALLIVLLLVILAIVFCASVVYIVEKGTFTVNSKYPQGQYLRVPVNGYGLEVSPFNSIPTSLYWSLTTLMSGEICSHALSCTIVVAVMVHAVTCIFMAKFVGSSVFKHQILLTSKHKRISPSV